MIFKKYKVFGSASINKHEMELGPGSCKPEQKMFQNTRLHGSGKKWEAMQVLSKS